jgi:hypothetical protein
VSAQGGRPPDRARSHRGISEIHDIRSDWRRWGLVERIGAVTIGVGWIGAVSILLVVNAG